MANKRPRIYWDLETYPNLFLFGYITDDPNCQGWKAYITPDKPCFTPQELQHMREMAAACTWYSFNGLNYDEPMFRLAMSGANNEQLKALNDAIIPGGGMPGIKRWEIKRAGWPQADIDGWDHVDIMEVLPGVRIGLKTYMARNHSKKLQDLPFNPGVPLTVDGMHQIWNYHNNDMLGTRELTNVCAARLALRERLSERYGVDMRSKSDAQMSESIITARLGYRPDVPYIPSGFRFRLIPAPWLQFATPYMQEIHALCKNVEFEFNRKDPGEELPDGTKTGVGMPDVLKKLKVTIGETTYKFGIGGLHSTEAARTVSDDDGEEKQDSDVAGFYPAMLILMKLLVPEQQAIYEAIYDERIAAKRLTQALESAGQKGSAEHTTASTESDGGKIVANGGYGKLWSKYSILLNPVAGVATTINGQLSLLMLIERLHMGGVRTLSANTDGIVTSCPPHLRYYRDSVMAWWEQTTGLQLEHKQYRLLAQRDVNSYVAVDSKGGIKRKGVFAESGVLSGMQGIHPDRDISKDAAVNWIVHGTPIADTVRACTDIRKFVMTRKAAGGAHHHGVYLGPTARWYYGAGQTEPLRAGNGNKVSDSDGAVPIQILPDVFPVDIDYTKYEAFAAKLVRACGLQV